MVMNLNPGAHIETPIPYFADVVQNEKYIWPALFDLLGYFEEKLFTQDIWMQLSEPLFSRQHDDEEVALNVWTNRSGLSELRHIPAESYVAFFRVFLPPMTLKFFDQVIVPGVTAWAAQNSLPHTYFRRGETECIVSLSMPKAAVTHLVGGSVMPLNSTSLEVMDHIRVALRGGMSFSDLKHYRG